MDITIPNTFSNPHNAMYHNVVSVTHMYMGNMFSLETVWY